MGEGQIIALGGMGWDGKDIRAFREFKADFFFSMGVSWAGGKIRKGEGRGREGE